MHTPRVFISSTFRDLELYRKEVDDICRMLNSQSITMEHFGSDHREPLRVCLEKVESADWLVGIYARRYGYVPPGETYSISELEYRHAVRHGKVIIAFVLRDGAEWPDQEPYTEKGEGVAKLKQFTNELVRTKHIVREFSTKDELGKLVAVELGRYHVRALKNESIVNPLSSLPLPDRLLYPAQSPYVGLRHFSRREARVFYGRSQLISTIYRKIANNPGAVTLLYGQTGVGKSSLLDAGLTPRLEQAGWQVSYLRREWAVGLATQLAQAYQNIQLTEKAQLLILDQVEELWTNTNPALPNEAIDFFVALQDITKATDNTLKLVLSFRKEFLADVEKLLEQYDIYREKQFVEPMNQRELAEAVTQVQEEAKARELYQIRVSERLPHEMAFDLWKDSQSHIAPLLQVTLSRMWATARKDKPEGKVVFDEALYYRVRSESLEDFLHSRLDALRNTFGEAVQSGLVLDILYYFTTDNATAAQHTISALTTRYADVGNLTALVQALENQYLLIDASEFLKEEKQEAKRLGHDALALLVQKAYRMADAPGQQAARILDSKQGQIVAHGTTEAVFSESDLRTLRDGKAGMRSWTEAEQAAYAHSLQATETLQRTLEERQKLAIRALSNGLVKDARLAFEHYKYSQAVRLAQKANEVDPTNWQAKEQLINARQHLPMLTDLQGHIGSVNSVVFSPDNSRILTASNDYTARLWNIQGNLLKILQGHTDAVLSAIFSPDGNRILTTSKDATAHLWDSQGVLLSVLQGNPISGQFAVFSTDSRYILTSGISDNEANLWNIHGSLLAVLEGYNGFVNSAIFSPDGSHIITASEEGIARIWDNQGVLLKVLKEPNGFVNSAIFSPDGSRIITASRDGKTRLWDGQGDLLMVLRDFYIGVGSGSIVFSPDSSRILTTPSHEGSVSLWDNQGVLLTVLNGPDDGINSAVFSPNGNRILISGSSGKTACLYDGYGSLLTVLEGHKGSVYSAVFSADGNYILTTSNKAVHLWDSQGNLLSMLQGYNDWLSTAMSSDWRNRAVFSPNGQYILTRSDDGSARLWLLNTAEILNDVNLSDISVLTWEEMKLYDIGSIEESAGINSMAELLSAEPHEMSLYHYAHYYYEIARTTAEDRFPYLTQSLKLYDRLIEYWPLNLYKQERETALALLNDSTTAL